MKTLTLVLCLLLTGYTVKAQTPQTVAALEAETQKCLDKGENMLGCEQRLYSQLDSVLNVAYKNLRVGLTPSDKDTLKSDEIKWLAIRDKAFADSKKALDSPAQDDRMIAYNEINNVVKARVLLLIARAKLNAPKTLTNSVQCIEKHGPKNKDGDYTTTRTCTYQNYRSVTVGEPDYKGRTFWTYALYLKKNGVYVKIKNEAIFNQNADALLAQLNKVFQKNYKKDRADIAKDPDALACFGDVTELEPRTWDDIYIELIDNGFDFNTSYGLGSACYSMDNTSTFLTFDSLKPYLRQ